VTDVEFENRAPAPLRSLIKLLQLILYVPIQVLFIPLALIGLVDAIYREMVKSKQLGVSFSAINS
jgi:hypothetical protein